MNGSTYGETFVLIITATHEKELCTRMREDRNLLFPHAIIFTALFQ